MRKLRNRAFRMRGGLVAAIVVGVALNLIGVATARANHPIPTGSVTCTPQGQQVITWTVTNSEFTVADGGTGRTMLITAIVMSVGTESGITVGDVLQPQPLAGSSETGTSTFAGTATGSVVFTVTGHFFNPDGSDSGITDTESATVTLAGGCATTPPPCPTGQKLNFRWHYSANGSAGSWSGTKAVTCPGAISEGPQAMEGDLKVSPGTTLLAGYDFTAPGNSTTFSVTVVNPQVVFTLACVSGATPSQSTLTVAMATTTYTVTGSGWVPSGDQHSPLVYQGSVAVPDVCSGGQVRLNQGGTFSATVQ